MDAVTLLAGAIDLGLEQAENALRRVRDVLRRADLPDLVQGGGQDLRARGELALGRFAPPSEPHMEALARRAATRDMTSHA
jgi:hypothetical protein